MNLYTLLNEMTENMSDKKEYGIVYLLTNECMPGLVKIGMTSRKDLDARMRELYTTGVPLPFECAYACKVKLSHMAELEAALHTAFAPNRVNENREFFRISPSQAVPLLKLMNHLNEGDATAEVAAEINNDIDAGDVAAIEKTKHARRPPLNFFDMGLRKGDVLVYADDPTKSVVIVDARKVAYQDVEQSLTMVTRLLQGKPNNYALQPTPFWLYNGERLTEVYDRAFPLIDE